MSVARELGRDGNAFTRELFPHLLVTGTEESVQPMVDVAVIIETIDIKHRPTAQNSGHGPHCRQLLFAPRLLFVQSDGGQKSHQAKTQHVKMHHATTQHEGHRNSGLLSSEPGTY